MRESVKENPPTEDEGRRHTVRWKSGEWDLLERAAEKLAAERRERVIPTDLIRAGALLRAEQILTNEAA